MGKRVVGSLKGSKRSSFPLLEPSEGLTCDWFFMRLCFCTSQGTLKRGKVKGPSHLWSEGVTELCPAPVIRVNLPGCWCIGGARHSIGAPSKTNLYFLFILGRGHCYRVAKQVQPQPSFTDCWSWTGTQNPLSGHYLTTNPKSVFSTIYAMFPINYLMISLMVAHKNWLW